MKKSAGKQKSQKKKKRGFGFTVIKYAVILLLFIFLAVGIFVYSVYCGLWGALPDTEELSNIRNDEASELYSEDGELLGKYYFENRTNVGFDNISNNAINALIATEDSRFYEHKGVDKTSLFRVFFKTFLLGDRSSGGGSTISQQLAKNLYPRDEQQVTFMPVVKLKEMFTAYKLETIYNKTQILALYLNTVSFGENTFGIESAAQKYFSTSATDLTIPQAATLIGMLKGPSLYNPRLHPERAIQRRNTVINQMVKYDFLTPKMGDKMKDTELDLNYKAINHYSGPAPYLREKIRQDAVKIIDDYNAKYGTTYNLYKDGMQLTTTLDAEMQRYAEAAVGKHMKSLQHSYYNHLGKKEPWNANPQILENAIKNSLVYQRLKHQGKKDNEIRKIMSARKPMLVYSAYQGETRVEFSSIDSIKHYLKLLQPAMIAVEPQTGKIKAWVGGLDFKYFQYDQVDAPRQVGSVFKPIVYSAAVSHGARLDAYYNNEQKTYSDYDDWSPRNADNKYEGFYTLKGALSRSINTIAVDVLMQTGIDTVIAEAHRLGIHSELPPYPSLALGVADIPLKEMVQPFAAFANNGSLADQYYLLEIKDKKGNILFKAPEPEIRNVMSAQDASIMNDMLSEVIEEGTGKKLRTVYGLQNDMAGKTGTTQKQVDGWFIGYNPRIVVGVRVGANDANIHFNSLSLGQGASMAMPIFGEFMQRCLQSNTYAQWNSLAFPMVSPEDAQELEIPEFKDHLSVIDKITNRKLDKIELSAPSADTGREKKGFFKKIGNIFRRDNR